MAKNKLIHLSTGEKCWFFMGICVGMMLSLVIAYLYTYLPLITPVQQAGLVGFICGGLIIYFLQKISWDDSK